MPILAAWPDYVRLVVGDSWRGVVQGSMDSYHLTPRQQDVCWHVLRGCSNKEIAAALYIGVETVKTHLEDVFRATGARDRLALGLLLLAIDPGSMIGDAGDTHNRATTRPVGC